MKLDPTLDLDPLNEVVHSARDFPSFFDAIQRRQKEIDADSYNDYSRSAPAVIQWHLQAFGLSRLAWALDRATEDSYLTKCQTLNAATIHAEQLGYKVTGASAASGDITVTMDPALVTKVSQFSRGHRFEHSSGRTYTVTADVSVPASSSSVALNIAEGIERELSFTSDGEKNQFFLLSGVSEGLYVAKDSVRLFVDGDEWDEVDFLGVNSGNAFEASYTTSPPEVRTGDGQFGNVPPVGADVLIRFRVISGTAGNFPSSTSTSVLTAVDPFLVDGDEVPIEIIPTNGASGGKEPQTIDEIKRLAPGFFGSRGSAVTASDYEVLAGGFSDPTFGAVAQGYAAVVRSTGNDTTTSAKTSAIKSASNTLASTFSSEEATMTALIASIDAWNAEISSSSSEISDYATDIQTFANTNRSDANLIATNTNTIEGNLDIFDSLVIDLEYAIETSNASTVQKNEIIGLIGSIKDVIRDGASSVSVATTAIKGVQTSLRYNADTADDAADGISTESATVSGRSASITSDTASITSSLQVISTAVSTENGIVIARTDELISHLSTLFDSSCKANIVNVPILTLDADGFYTAPSSGLVNACQEYLNGIKEVSQYVIVSSGEAALVPADIRVYVRYSNSLIKSEAKAAIEAAIDELLKGRKFGEVLYLSRPEDKAGLYDVTRNIEGVEHLNIEIVSPADKLDSYGNLVPDELEVVTKLQVLTTEI